MISRSEYGNAATEGRNAPAKSGSFFEILKVAEFNGIPIQLIDVFRDREKIYSSPRPSGFTEN
jgi:hypothetical protein